MTQGERKATLALSSIFALRMLGLFMIMPVFALYGHQLRDATPALIGLAIGVYGLAQAVLQIPIGLLADRMNRKVLIVQGLMLFAVGGAVAALSDSIWGVIIGRTIQGAGAISAVVMALLADLTREEQRTKAMSTIGMSIGLSFAVAFVIGPFVAAHFGLSGLFWATSLLAVMGLGLMMTVPTPTITLKQTHQTYGQQLRQSVVHGELSRLNIGIFVLHLVMTASFVLLPHLLTDYAHLPASQHGWVYLPIVLGGFVAAVPAIIIAEKKRKIKQVFVAGIALLTVSLVLLAQGYPQKYTLLMGISVFFIAFNLLEALLPSLLSKIAPAGTKATAMGIYASSQFLGAFCGGVLGGILYGLHSISLAYIILALCSILWLVVALTMQSPRFLHSMMLNINPCTQAEAAVLLAKLQPVVGVEEVVVLAQEGVVYLKVDKERLDEPSLKNLVLA
ncbi:MFS transporter [Agitococcus lubricus]|nr:MFS transporter [Agitococcus lubricus]